jgi:hypothetical protein
LRDLLPSLVRNDLGFSAPLSISESNQVLEGKIRSLTSGIGDGYESTLTADIRRTDLI